MKLIDKVKIDPSIMRQFSTPPVDIQKAAIKADFKSIRYIKNPNQEIQCFAVKLGGLEAYKLINNPCYDAKKILAAVQPMKISRHIKVDEALMEIAIRANTDCVATFKEMPYRLQKLARDLSKPVELINLIIDPHPDLVREYLKEKNRISILKSVPPDVELEYLNNSKSFKHVISYFSQLRNPSLIAQKHYVSMVIAMARRENETLPPDVWKGVSNRVDDDMKYEILHTVDLSKNIERTMGDLRRIFRGNDALMSALTLMA